MADAGQSSIHDRSYAAVPAHQNKGRRGKVPEGNGPFFGEWRPTGYDRTHAVVKQRSEFHFRFTGRKTPKPEIDLTRLHHRSEEHTSELQSLRHLVCRLLLE